MARLPRPGEDNGTWGSILNEYLSQIHEGDGTLKTDVVTGKSLAPNAVDEVALGAAGGIDGQVLVKDSSSTAGMKWATVTSGSGAVPSASQASEGTIRLSGDLGGTAQSPTVPGLASKADIATTYTKSQVDAALSAKQNISSLSAVAISGDYKDIINKPAPVSPTPAATTTTTGTIVLAGDLGGTSTAPAVTKVNGIAITGAPTAGQVLTALDGTHADWQTPVANGGPSQAMHYVWANDDGTWPAVDASTYGPLSANNMLSFIVPSTALPGATRFPAPPISINSRYILYYGPAPIGTIPTVSITSTSVSGRSVTFKATATLAEGSVSTYKWNFSDDTSATTIVNTVSHVFSSPGSVSCTVVITDNYNLTNSATTSLTVSEGAPTVTITSSVNGSTVVWTAAASDPEAAPLTYSWSGTDSLSGSSASVTQAYQNLGAKTATVVVADDKGTTATATADVVLVAVDSNNIVTADTFTTAAADAVAVGSRTTEPGSLGGVAMKPARTSGAVSISGGALQWIATQPRGGVTYWVGAMHPRIVMTITGVNAGASGYISFNHSNGNIAMNFLGNGSITWSRTITSPSSWYGGNMTGAGTWSAGDRFDADVVQSTGILTLKHYRAGTLIDTYTSTITAPNLPCNTIGIGSAIDRSIFTVDDVVIAVVP